MLLYMLTLGVDGGIDPPKIPDTIEFLGMTINKVDFYTGIAIATVAGAIGLGWAGIRWYLRRRLAKKFPSEDA